MRLLASPDKEASLRRATNATTSDERRISVDVGRFAALPGSPFAYWIDERVRRLFVDLDPFEHDGRTAKVGLQTGEDFRFVRTWWEIGMGCQNGEWFTFAKGGRFARFYSALDLVVNWRDGGRQVASLADPVSGRIASRTQNTTYYFRPGITWSDRTTRLFSARVWPANGIFSVKGSAGFVQEFPLGALAVMNSIVFSYLLSLLVGAADAAARSYQVGTIGTVPWPPDTSSLSALARRAWSLRRSLDTRTEVSHAFVLPALLQVEGGSLAMRADAWAGRVRGVDSELAAIQAEIDERCFDLYGIDEADRGGIGEGLAGAVESSDAEDAEVDLLVDDGGDVDGAADASGLAAELVSWAVGVAFGRFDVRLATGARELPGVPEPFDPLPVCSPGMLVGGDGLPVAVAPSGYPVDFPVGGVLVDDLGDSRDLTGAVRTVFDRVFGMSADALWDEAAALLDPRSHGLRAWLRSGFFDHHLKRHSKSRRKAPILWQLGTPSGRYSVWLYAHRLTEDSLFQLQNDVVAPKLAYEERQLTSLVQSSGGSRVGEGASQDRGAGGVCRGAARAARGGEAGGAAVEADAG